MSHSSSLLIQSAAGLESLGHMTWKILKKKMQLFCINIHPSIACNYFILFMGLQGLLLEPIPAVSGRRQSTPWTSCQLITGPLLMAEATVHGANRTSGAIWGLASCSRTLRHEAQPRAGIWTSDLPITSWPDLPAELQLPLVLIYLR